MSAIHTVTVETDDDGDPSRWTFACSGGDDDRCRQWCAEGCDTECSWEVHRWEALKPPYCRDVEWLDAAGAEGCYVGADDDEPIPARSGRIDIEWTGDDYAWRYWDAAPVEARP